MSKIHPGIREGSLRRASSVRSRKKIQKNFLLAFLPGAGVLRDLSKINGQEHPATSISNNQCNLSRS
jgi:hypothetical protein